MAEEDRSQRSKILKMPIGEARTNALDELTGELPASRQAYLQSVVNRIDEISYDRDKQLEDSRASYDKMVEEEQLISDSKSADRNKALEKIVEQSKPKQKIIEKVIIEKPSKITNDELNKVQSIIDNINRAQLEIGSFETKKHNLLHHVTIMQQNLRDMQLGLEKSYGTADINIEDGTINYENNGKTN